MYIMELCHILMKAYFINSYLHNTYTHDVYYDFLCSMFLRFQKKLVGFLYSVVFCERKLNCWSRNNEGINCGRLVNTQFVNRIHPIEFNNLLTI